jgi:hypothetical protein
MCCSLKSRCGVSCVWCGRRSVEKGAEWSLSVTWGIRLGEKMRKGEGICLVLAKFLHAYIIMGIASCSLCS